MSTTAFRTTSVKMVAAFAGLLLLAGGCSDSPPPADTPDGDSWDGDLWIGDDGGDADNGDADFSGDLCAEAGATECTVEGHLRTCVDGDVRLEWSEPEPCESGRSCFEGMCRLEGDSCDAPSTGECLDDFTIRHCEGESGDAVWTEPTPCDDGSHCHDGACIIPELTTEQQEYLDLVNEFLDLQYEYSAWIEHIDLDLETVRDEVYWIIVLGDESPRTLYTALRAALLAFPVGHQGLYSTPEVCSSPDIYWQTASRLGVCARPSGDVFVITHTIDHNPMGLERGDQVTAVDGDEGEAMVEAVLRYPVCGASSAGPSNRRIAAATSLFSSIPVGTVIDIVNAADGSAEQLEIPDEPAIYLDCRDPMGRNTWFNANSYIRPDGVAVIQAPRFFPLGMDYTAPYEELYEAMESALLEAFESVLSAQAIIWDIRANTGGISPVAFRVVEGMPGARAVHIAHIGTRIPGVVPVQVNPMTEGDYEVSPGGPFAYDGQVAVLVDGLSVSAADYFTRAVSLATDVPIVGTGAAAAYGGAGYNFEFGDDPVFTTVIDPYLCSDIDGVPLEGLEVEPDLFVELDALDLAIGIDTQLEAAAALLLSE